MNRTIPNGAAILLAFIRKTEVGRDDRASYDVIYNNKQGHLPKPLTSMTYGEIIDAQRSWSKNFGSSAAGGYQCMRQTLIDLAKEYPSISGDDVYTPEFQDQLGYALLLRRGYELFVAGKFTRTEFGKRLAQEWASFPVLVATRGKHREVARGQSFYAGDGLNKALVEPEKVEAILDQALATARAEAAAAKPKPVVVEKPVVADPGELEQSPMKSKTVWQWIITTVLVPVLAVFQDWRVQLVIVGIVTLFAVYAIKRRFDLAKAVKELKAEFEA
ncbi:hypothetical protein [Shinella zoogloeoides]|uniref:hypothetical protein n=1 Tax=Shinella zoogloeoides TaxID=352475 RepID=UPI0028AB6E3C|nr:hypothetical protein [Shinella zoogloeoides]